MESTMNFKSFSNDALIAIANAISADIDQAAIDSQSMTKSDYMTVENDLKER